MNTRLSKIVFLILIICLSLMTPPPDGLSKEAWILASIYLAAIIGLVSKPYPEPVIIIAALAASCIAITHFSGSTIKPLDALNGYSSGTTWLVFSAFTLSAAFVSTGLGKRLAYWFIYQFGGTTLGLGYVTVLLDLILSPATPSNTARGGGIVFPIINSIALALNSTPKESPCKAGRYLMVNIYMVTKTTSYMFLTAFAGNALALQLISDVFHIHISWTGWALAGAPLGLIMLSVIPYITYKVTKPELKKINNKEIALKGLNEIGAMNRREKGLIAIFILALLGWIFSRQLGLNECSVAIIAMASALLFNVICWDDVLKSKGGWNTLIWYGGIIGLSGVLSKAGFFSWLAKFLSENISHMHFGSNVIIFIVFLSIVIRYLFASGGAYVAAMVPVFATLGLVTGADPIILSLAILFSNSYGGCITHYGGAAGPIIFAAGYNDIKSWWLTGTIVALFTFITHIVVGFPWWEYLKANGLL